MEYTDVFDLQTFLKGVASLARNDDGLIPTARGILVSLLRVYLLARGCDVHTVIPSSKLVDPSKGTIGLWIRRKMKKKYQLEYLHASSNPLLCPIKWMYEYIDRLQRADLWDHSPQGLWRGATRQTNQKTKEKQRYSGLITKDTLRCDIQLVMQEHAGIDTTVHKLNSLRHATASFLVAGGVAAATVMSRAGWTSYATFLKYYNVQLQSNNWSDMILNCCTDFNTEPQELNDNTALPSSVHSVSHHATGAGVLGIDRNYTPLRE